MGGRPGRGLALVAVLWIVAALSILVLSVAQTSRLNTHLVQYDRAQTEARWLLEAGLVVGMARASWIGAGSVRHFATFELDGTKIRVGVFPATGFVDLNHAPEDLLFRLFRRAGGLHEEAAGSLAAELVQWRGSQAPAADAQAVPYRGPLRAVDELALVPGAGPELRDTISDLVTVYSRSAHVNPYAAPDGVLRMLAEGSEHWVEAVAVEAPEPQRPPSGLPEALAEEPFLALGGSRILRVEARTEWRGRAWSLARWVELGQGSGTPLGAQVLRTDRLRSRTLGEPD